MVKRYHPLRKYLRVVSGSWAEFTAYRLNFVLLSSMIRSFALGTRTDEVGDVINDGNLSNFLVRPINFFRYYMARDLADKALIVLFGVGEFTFLILLPRPPLYLQADIGILLLTGFAVILGTVLYFCMS